MDCILGVSLIVAKRLSRLDHTLVAYQSRIILIEVIFENSNKLNCRYCNSHTRLLVLISKSK